MILDAEKMRKILREFSKNPDMHWASVYSALETDPNPKDVVDDNFEEFARKWREHPELFQKGSEPYNFEQSSFSHVRDAGYIAGRLKHRIYVNPPQENRPQFIHNLIKKCIENEMAYYFKYRRDNTRFDSLVIYSSDDQLATYKKVLNELEKEMPKTIAQCGDVPLSAQKIGWYGYGVEEKSNENGSYTERIAQITRKHINRQLLNNMELFKGQTLTQEQIQMLSDACREATASRISKSNEPDSAQRAQQVRAMGAKIIEFLQKNQEGLLAGVLNSKIEGHESQIDNDYPLANFYVDGIKIDLTPSAFTMILATMKPQWKSHEQRDEFYKTLANACEEEFKKEGLSVEIPVDLAYSRAHTEEESKKHEAFFTSSPESISSKEQQRQSFRDFMESGRTTPSTSTSDKHKDFFTSTGKGAVSPKPKDADADPDFFFATGITRAVAIEEIKKDAKFFKRVASKFGDDKEIVSLAVAGNADNYQYASDSLKRDKEFTKSCIDAKKEEIKKAEGKKNEDGTVDTTLITLLQNQVIMMTEQHKQAVEQHEQQQQQSQGLTLSM